MTGEDAINHRLPIRPQVQGNAHVRIREQRRTFRESDAAVVAARIDEHLQPLLAVQLCGGQRGELGAVEVAAEKPLRAGIFVTDETDVDVFHRGFAPPVVLPGPQREGGSLLPLGQNVGAGAHGFTGQRRVEDRSAHLLRGGNAQRQQRGEGRVGSGQSKCHRGRVGCFDPGDELVVPAQR